MLDFRFDTVGVNRSYLDFYRGFGFSLSVFLVLQAVAFSGSCPQSPPRIRRQVRPIVASFAVASIVGGILAWCFLFPVPAEFSVVLSACLVLAAIAAR